MSTIGFDERVRVTLAEVLRVLSWASGENSLEAVLQWLRSIQIDELEPGISGSGVIDSDNALFGGGCKTFNRCIAIITFYVNGDENKVFKAEISLIQSPRIGWIVYKWQSRVNGITQTHSVRFMGGLNTDNLTLVNRCPPNPCDSRFFYWPFRSLESDL